VAKLGIDVKLNGKIGNDQVYYGPFDKNNK